MPQNFHLMSGVGIYPTLLVTTITIAASSAWTLRTGGTWLFDDSLINQGGFVRMESTHHGQHTLENQPLDYFVRARLTVVCAVLGAGINNFDCRPSPAVAPGTHNQSPFRFGRYRAGVMASGPAGAAALFKIIASHHAQRPGRVKVVIRTISGYAALACDLRYLARSVAAFDGRAGAHGRVSFDDMEAKAWRAISEAI